MDKLKVLGEDFGCPLRPLDLEQAYLLKLIFICSKKLCSEHRTHTSSNLILWILTKLYF